MGIVDLKPKLCYYCCKATMITKCVENDSVGLVDLKPIVNSTVVKFPYEVKPENWEQKGLLVTL